MLDHLVFDRGFGTLKKKKKKWGRGGVFEDPEEDVRTDAQMSASLITRERRTPSGLGIDASNIYSVFCPPGGGRDGETRGT